MDEARKGDWIETIGGRKFYPLDPRPEDIDINDIARALSMQCRFGGHVRQFYSVAEHSLKISRVLTPRDALWGLLHDASEAYLVDLPSPIKHEPIFSAAYRSAEIGIMRCVAERFGLEWPEPAQVKRADLIALHSEHKWLASNTQVWEHKWGNPEELYEIESTLGPAQAEWQFLSRFIDLTEATTATQILIRNKINGWEHANF